MITFFAPPFRWSEAVSFSVKRPVHSCTTVAPVEDHFTAAGSFSANIWIFFNPFGVSIIIMEPSTFTAPG